ncbi:cyclic nucleotide-binding domain-containing protein [Catalinimonas niigatensis]|uniref:cyclic nucleotide-binding domain-containing protein n=1 Tax=Catalinimonas niigatensis TaxID=1397264 RepID=UPI002665D5F7|nr:cyclic nucleotide-binding domain-containing protein [Catalinimonas niigatensis]WPP49816.1 cyclic nucleotide-binding domain-containing protein [Catalinimonas niigatensis]
MNRILHHQTFLTNDADLSSPFIFRKGMNFLNNEHETSFFEKEQLIFKENSTAWGMYYLQKGKVKLFKYGSDGKE